MAQLFPYVRFNDKKCSEAMNFYKDIFGGELELMKLGDSPMAKDSPKETHDMIMHSTLKNGCFEFCGSDMMRDRAVVGDSVTMMINCDSEEQIKGWFDKLSQGGDVFMSIEEAFWGSLFGVVTDKYGIEWSLNFPLKK